MTFFNQLDDHPFGRDDEKESGDTAERIEGQGENRQLLRVRMVKSLRAKQDICTHNKDSSDDK